MRKTDISKMSVEGLVERFVEIALQMDQAILLNQNAKYNRFFDQEREIVDELKRREGDQRRRLLPLFSHPNIFVRLQAAVSTRAVAPFEARSQLQAIADARLDTYSSEARSFLRALDDQRRLLLPLFSHPNVFVRLQAAKSTLALAPVEARSQIQAIANERLGIHSLDAGMCLRALDEGIFKPT